MIATIETDEEYQAALTRCSELMGAELDIPEGDELLALVDLLEVYGQRFIL